MGETPFLLPEPNGRVNGEGQEPSRVTGFAPADPSDNRGLLEWQSKYPPEARKNIYWEAVYLGALIIVVAFLMLALWLEYPKVWFTIPDEKYGPIQRYGFAWLSGVLGGTLLDIKWMYHSVARQIWHLDRRLWRLFMPHVSGVTAFAVIALIGSGVFRVLDERTTQSLSMIVGIGFLMGYFSDFAIAKLFEIAETLFGASRTRKSSSRGTSRKSSPRQGM